MLGNGDPLMMSRYRIGPGEGSKAVHSVSNRAHLEAGFHKHYTHIGNDFQVVLFHYVTRSQNYFVENKISRRSGIYATTYAELQANDTQAGELLPSLECHAFSVYHRQGPDSSATPQGSTGWSPVASTITPNTLQY